MSIDVAIAPAEREPVAYGPYHTVEGAPPVAVGLYRRTDLATPVADLADSWGRRWLDQLNEPGSGSVTLANDDPQLDAVGDGDVIRFTLHGFAAFSMLVRNHIRTSIAETEEHAETTTLSGPGLLAVLDEAVVHPSRGVGAWPIEEDRVFSWPSVDYDDTWWGIATVIAPDIATMANFYITEGAPHSAEGFPDPTASVLWGGPDASMYGAPVGDVYFRGTIVAPEQGSYRLYWLLDNWGTVYFDGQSISSTTGKETFADAVTAELVLSPGPHTVAVVGTNWFSPDYNPGAFALCVYAIDAAGNPTVLAGHSDPTWKALPYPATPPGMTPGEAINICVTEAQARGALAGVTLTFNRHVDSDGVAWPIVGDIATKVGTDLLTFVRELCATYVDVWMEPAAYRLHAYIQDGLGTHRDAVLHGPTDPDDPNSSNLAGLNHRRVL